MAQLAFTAARGQLKTSDQAYDPNEPGALCRRCKNNLFSCTVSFNEKRDIDEKPSWEGRNVPVEYFTQSTEMDTSVRVETPSQWLGTRQGDIRTWGKILEMERKKGIKLKVSRAVMISEADLEGPTPTFNWEPSRVQVSVTPKGKRRSYYDKTRKCIPEKCRKSDGMFEFSPKRKRPLAFRQLRNTSRYFCYDHAIPFCKQAWGPWHPNDEILLEGNMSDPKRPGGSEVVLSPGYKCPQIASDRRRAAFTLPNTSNLPTQEKLKIMQHKAMVKRQNKIKLDREEAPKRWKEFQAKEREKKVQGKRLSSCTPYYPAPSVHPNPSIPLAPASTLILINGESQARDEIPNPLAIQHPAAEAPIKSCGNNNVPLPSSSAEIPTNCEESPSSPDPADHPATTAIIAAPASTIYLADGEFPAREEIPNPLLHENPRVERPLYVAGEVEIALPNAIPVHELESAQAEEESDLDSGDGPVEWDTDNPENSDDGSGIPRMDPSKIETMDLD